MMLCLMKKLLLLHRFVWVVGLMVKGLIRWGAWPFGTAFAVRLVMEGASIGHYTWASWGSVSQTVVAAQRVRNLHHLRRRVGLR